MTEPASSSPATVPPALPARLPVHRLLLGMLGDVLAVLLLLVVFGALLAGVGALWRSASGGGAAPLADRHVELISGLAVLAAIALLDAKWPLRAFALPPRRVGTWQALGVGLLGGAAMLLVDAGLERALAAAGIAFQAANERYIRDTLTAAPALGLLMFAVLAPVVEEWVLRRRLFGRFWRGGRPWLGLVVTSVFFALLHEFGKDDGQSWAAWSVLILVYSYAGAVFAWLYWRTGRLLAAITAHAVNNLVLCVAMLAGWA